MTTAKLIWWFCKFEKIFDEIKAKELLKEGSKGADVNEGKFVLNIDALFAFNIRTVITLKADRCV
jgi:hypothetical protein